MRYFCTFLFITITLPFIAFAKKQLICVYAPMWHHMFDDGGRDDVSVTYLAMCQAQRENRDYEFRHVGTLANLHDADCIICFDVPINEIDTLIEYPKEKLLLFLWEPPTVSPFNYYKEYHHPFSRIYTWHDELVDNVRYFKLHYPMCHPMIKELIPFEQKKLVTMVFANKNSSHAQELYSHRRWAIEFFEKYHPDQFDLYGLWWPTQYHTYKGSIANKVPVLKQYKFCFAYENVAGQPGYVTEKIFDCFSAGCVPIYWGAPNITDYIPANCFIDRRKFADLESLYTYLNTMSEKEYQKYIDAIASFLQSKSSDAYKPQTFVDLFLDSIARCLKGA
jgi:hypothetical protein